MTRAEIADKIADEMREAHEKYGPFTSAHEGYGVLAEEMVELLEAVHANEAPAVQREACQVAAVAWRLAECLTDDNEATLKRSGMR